MFKFSMCEPKENVTAATFPVRNSSCGRTCLPTSKEMRFKPKDEIQALLVEAGLAPGQEVVTYCAVGMRASLMYFAARYVGVPSRVYLGSWNDWRQQSGYPIAGGGGN